MNPWRGLGGLSSTVWLVCGSTLVNRLGTMALPFLLLYLTEARRWTPEQAGMALMVYGAGGLVSAPLSGRLSDRLGHARILKASLLLSGLTLLAIPFAAPRWGLFALIALWAMLGQAFWPAAMALLVGQAPPERRKAVYALHRLAVNLGMAVGPALGGFIAHHSFSWVFWTDGLSTILSGLILLAFLRPTPEAHPEGGPPGRSPWTDPRLIYLLAAFLPALMVFFQIEGALPLYVVRDLDLGTRFYGLLFTLNTLIIVALEVALNLAMGRWPHGRQLMLGAALMAVGFGLTAFAFTRSALLATAVVWTFGEMVLLPGMSDAVGSLAPPDRRGEYMGLLSLCFAASLALGPWLGVLSYARLGPAMTWGACCLVALLSAALLGRFRGRAA